MKTTTSPRSGRARIVLAFITTAAVAAVAPGIVQAAPKTDEPFGQHVSECAKTSVGKRVNPPEVTCMHDGHVHLFANFGEMVQHMREHLGG